MLLTWLAPGSSPSHQAVCHSWRSCHRRSSIALLTTLTLLKATAAPASIRLSRPNAASGMHTTLQAKAQNRLCWIFR